MYWGDLTAMLGYYLVFSHTLCPRLLGKLLGTSQLVFFISKSSTALS